MRNYIRKFYKRKPKEDRSIQNQILTPSAIIILIMLSMMSLAVFYATEKETLLVKVSAYMPLIACLATVFCAYEIPNQKLYLDQVGALNIALVSLENNINDIILTKNNFISSELE